MSALRAALEELGMTTRYTLHIAMWIGVLFLWQWGTRSEAEDLFPHKTSLRYAQGFSIEYHDTYKVMTVLTPWKDANNTFQYVLVQRGTAPPDGYTQAQIVEIPVRSLVTMSTSYLPYVVKLGVLDTLVGHDNFDYISSPEVLERIAAGQLQEIGEGQNVNIELLLMLNPDLIMTHSVTGVSDSHPKLLEAGFSVAMNAAYMEPMPLGQAEWIKFIAAFFNKEEAAEAEFTRIATAYEELAAKTRELEEKPTVFVNAPYEGIWWIPGGKGYAAAFLRDAGADYLWDEMDSAFTTPIDVEIVYARAAQADYWMNPGQWNSLRDGLAVDERFAQFEAFKQGNVYNSNARLNRYGGDDYWESGLANPHIILADLIKIFHPELVPEHELVYYHQLK
jgi:iron complex transport system substrate-binding protein